MIVLHGDCASLFPFFSSPFPCLFLLLWGANVAEGLFQSFGLCDILDVPAILLGASLQVIAHFFRGNR
ncbi:hypothetical protein BD769DRAFT_1461533 [Suillus cothurnatus]|nr:hypothetical protein BD769DRAFT_1461533 [Suillus cothurnatus]